MLQRPRVLEAPKSLHVCMLRLSVCPLTRMSFGLSRATSVLPPADFCGAALGDAVGTAVGAAGVRDAVGLGIGAAVSAAVEAVVDAAV